MELLSNAPCVACSANAALLRLDFIVLAFVCFAPVMIWPRCTSSAPFATRSKLSVSKIGLPNIARTSSSISWRREIKPCRVPTICTSLEKLCRVVLCHFLRH